MWVPTHRMALRTTVTKPRRRLAHLLLPAVLGEATISRLLAGAGGSGEQLLLWEGLQGASSLVHLERHRGALEGDRASSGVPACTAELRRMGGRHSPGRGRQGPERSRHLPPVGPRAGRATVPPRCLSGPRCGCGEVSGG